MPEEKGYNGWSNYETWCVKLWIDNDEASYNRFRRIVRSAETKSKAADEVKEMMYDEMPNLGGTLWADLLSAAFGEVDWFEMVESEWDDLHSDDSEGDDSDESEEEE
jgi:hypothetical protein